MAKKKKDLKFRVKKIQFRATEFDFNRIKSLADRYADGNMSKWIVAQSSRIPDAKRIGGKPR